jgi:DNA topoisomerase IA
LANLVVVESRAKAKTIEKFLGRAFSVKPCFGHVRDLPTKSLGVDVKRDFQPRYVVPDDRKEIVSDLRKEAQKADGILPGAGSTDRLPGVEFSRSQGPPGPVSGTGSVRRGAHGRRP